MKRKKSRKRRPVEKRLRSVKMGPPPAAGGRTRTPGEPMPDGAEQGFQDAEPPGFKDHPRSSVYAAETDPDADDTIGAE